MSEHFKVGTIVALCNYSSWGPRSISKREVYKVRKDGKFYVKFQRGEEVVCSDTMWAPDRFGSPEANPAGRKGYSRERIEVWTEKHDAEIAERRLVRAAEDRKAELLEAVKAFRAGSEADRVLMNKMLQLLPPKEGADGFLASQRTGFRGF